MRIHLMSVVIAVALSYATTALAETITVVTEESAPLSYMRDGKIMGEGTVLVEQTLRRAGLDYTLHLYPWARAISMATSDPNVLIYSIGKTAERETQFKWVGEVAPMKYSLYKMRNRADVVVNTLEDAKKYRIGVQKGDNRAKYLEQKGFTHGLTQGLQEVTNNSLNLKKLEGGRIDLVPISQAGIKGLCSTEGLDCSQYEPAFDLGLRVHLYMAFSNATPDPVVEKLQNAYNDLKKEGVLKKIMPDFWD